MEVDDGFVKTALQGARKVVKRSLLKPAEHRDDGIIVEYEEINFGSYLVHRSLAMKDGVGSIRYWSPKNRTPHLPPQAYLMALLDEQAYGPLAQAFMMTTPNGRELLVGWGPKIVPPSEFGAVSVSRDELLGRALPALEQPNTMKWEP